MLFYTEARALVSQMQTKVKHVEEHAESVRTEQSDEKLSENDLDFFENYPNDAQNMKSFGVPCLIPFNSRKNVQGKSKF